jgi:hypothetical protein
MGKIAKRGFIIFKLFIAFLIIVSCTGAPKKPDQIIPGNYDYAKEYITKKKPS